MLSLTLVGNPSAFLPQYFPNTRLISLMVLGLCPLPTFCAGPGLAHQAGTLGDRSVFCSSLYPLLPTPLFSLTRTGAKCKFVE